MKARRYGNRFALRAIDDYRAAPVNEERWHLDGGPSWRRALQLAASLKATARDQVAQMEDALVEAFCDAKVANSRDPLKFLRPLANEGLGRQHAPKVADLLEQLARHLMQQGHAFKTAAYLDAAKFWFNTASKGEKAAEMQLLLAKTWEKHTDSGKSALTRHGFYGDAIRAYRAVPARFRGLYDVDNAIQAIRVKYEEAGRQTVGNDTDCRTIDRPNRARRGRDRARSAR
jgi:hypothetical protein